jgi:hypothetical protein
MKVPSRNMTRHKDEITGTHQDRTCAWTNDVAGSSGLHPCILEVHRVRPELCAGIPTVAYQRKACNRCNHFIDRAPTTLSKMLSSTRPRDDRGVERQGGDLNVQKRG